MPEVTRDKENNDVKIKISLGSFLLACLKGNKALVVGAKNEPTYDIGPEDDEKFSDFEDLRRYVETELDEIEANWE